MLATKQLKSALESFKSTVEALDDSGLSLDERRKRQLDVQIMLTMMAKDKNLKNGAYAYNIRIYLHTPIHRSTTATMSCEVRPERRKRYPTFTGKTRG